MVKFLLMALFVSGGAGAESKVVRLNLTDQNASVGPCIYAGRLEVDSGRAFNVMFRENVVSNWRQDSKVRSELLTDQAGMQLLLIEVDAPIRSLSSGKCAAGTYEALVIQ